MSSYQKKYDQTAETMAAIHLDMAFQCYREQIILEAADYVQNLHGFFNKTETVEELRAWAKESR